MKKLFFISVIFLLVSCGERTYPVTTSQFIITDIVSRDGQLEHLTTYHVQMPDNTNLGSIDFWFSDSIGKYNVGDIVEFNKKK